LSSDRWRSYDRPTNLYDLMLLVALTALPLAAAATTLRTSNDPIVRGIVVLACLAVPTGVGLVWFVCRLWRPRGERTRDDLFLVVYIVLTLVSVLATVLVFLFDRPAAGMLGLALFGLLAYLSSWI
jgi:uncharacterized membrane-anchored protein